MNDTDWSSIDKCSVQAVVKRTPEIVEKHRQP